MPQPKSLARRLLPWALVVGFAVWIVVIVVLITTDPGDSAG
jgi:hypothetical protein